MAGKSSAHELDLYDDTEDILDYGDSFDIDADLDPGLPATDSALDEVSLEAYDEFDLGPEEELEDLAPHKANSSAKTDLANEGTKTDAHPKETDPAPKSSNNVESGNGGNNAAHNNGNSNTPQNRNNSFHSHTKGQENEQQSDSSHGGYNQHYNSGRPYTNVPQHGGAGRGTRGRGQGYGQGSMNRGNFQGGMGRHPNMGMGMSPMGMGPGVNMGMHPMNMNLNMGMMGLGLDGLNPMMGMGMGMNGGGRFPGDGFGNQGMGFPYGAGQEMGGGGRGMNRMNPNMNPGAGGLNVRAPGRTIHINPNFKNRAVVPPVAGAAPGFGQAQPNQPYPSTPFQGANRDQSKSWESKPHSGGYDSQAGDFRGKNQTSQDNDRRYSTDRPGNDRPSVSSGAEKNNRYENEPPRQFRSDRDRDENAGLTSRSSTERRTSDVRSYVPDSSRRSQGSPHISGSPSGSITGRLGPGLKRASEGFDASSSGNRSDDSNKVSKSHGGSTPRSEQERMSDSSPRVGGSEDSQDRVGSVSFLRGKREPGTESTGESRREYENGSKATPTGFVKIENLPDSATESMIRKLAEGVSGVSKVLVFTRNEGKVTLGFASVEEAKFFRRQINRTTVEGSLITVTLASNP